MTISSRVQQQMFVQTRTKTNETRLIRLPTGSYHAPSSAAASPWTPTPQSSPSSSPFVSPPVPTTKPPRRASGWTDHEHERFLEGLEMYPQGPWKMVALHVGTKSARQAMTHAQKYRQKIERRQRGLRKRGGMVTHPTPRAQIDQPTTSASSHNQVQAVTIVAKRESASPSVSPTHTQAAQSNAIDAYELDILNELLATFDPTEFSDSTSDSGLEELFAPPVVPLL